MIRQLLAKKIPSIVFLMTIILMPCLSTLAQDAGPSADATPEQIIKETLDRIYHRRQPPEADRRDLTMTTAESESANLAGRLFNTVQYRLSFGYPQAVYDPSHQATATQHRAKLEAVIQKYRGQTDLSSEAKEEIKAALWPFTRYLQGVQALREGKLLVLPGEKCQFKLDTFCMDSNWPAPRHGEKMRLVPVTNLLPEPLAETHTRLMEGAATGIYDHRDIQALVWTLRHVAQDVQGKNRLVISDSQRKILDAIEPEGYDKLVRYWTFGQKTELDKATEKLVREKVSKKMKEMRDSGVFQTQHVPNMKALEAVASQLQRLQSMPVEQPIPKNNSHYTTLQDGVYARAIYGSLIVEVANNSEQPAEIATATLAGESERKVQRMSLGPANQTSTTEQVSVDTSKAIGNSISMLLANASSSNHEGFLAIYPLMKRDISIETNMHIAHAIDILTKKGVIVYPIADGIIYKINPLGEATGTGTNLGLNDEPGRGFGKYIIIKHSLPNGKSVWSTYGHLGTIQNGLKENEFVSLLQPIGTVGDTGAFESSSGHRKPHLHLQIDLVEPWNNTNIVAKNKAFPVPPYQAEHFQGTPYAGQDTRDLTTDPIAFLKKYGAHIGIDGSTATFDRSEVMSWLSQSLNSGVDHEAH